MLMMRPHFARRNRRRGRTCAQERAGDVDPEHGLPLVQRDLVERPHRERGEDRGIVDEDVDPSEFVLHGARHGGDRIRIGNIGRDGASTPACFANLHCHRIAARSIALGDDRNGAGLRQRLGEGAAQPLSGAGDHRDAIRQSRKDRVAAVRPAFRRAHAAACVNPSSAARASQGCHHGSTARSRAMSPAAI